MLMSFPERSRCIAVVWRKVCGVTVLVLSEGDQKHYSLCAAQQINAYMLWRALHNRKNWLFSASVKGVTASANLYSLIETVKANGLEPYAYLRHLFTQLPKAETVDAIEALLPGTIGKDQIGIG